MIDVALVTEDRLESPVDVDWYVGNVLEEDRIFAEALAGHGLSSARVSWSRPQVEWSAFRCAILRTPWDYFHRYPEFHAWLGRVSAATRLINAPETVLWNCDKHYLLDLERAGLPVAATQVLERGTTRSVADVMSQRGWDQVVVKPAVSGAGRHTYRITHDDVLQHEALIAELLAVEAMLVQPFLPAVVERGEVTVVVIDGRTTHALLKRARAGEFRVQDDFGGTLHEHHAAPDELELTERAIAACQPRPLYGRVDMVRVEDDTLRIMELELVEPELWFRRHPPAALRLAAAVAATLDPR